jgi:hypothetical protein
LMFVNKPAVFVCWHDSLWIYCVSVYKWYTDISWLNLVHNSESRKSLEDGQHKLPI